jgi:5-hydroxyisourate hydrolase
MTTLTTHILDTAHGCPAAGVRIDLSRMEQGRPRLLTTSISNGEGRTDRPLLAGGALSAGSYELQFHVGDYFSSRGVCCDQPPFLDVVPLWFGIANPTLHCHVPLLVTPWSYATYRGS